MTLTAKTIVKNKCWLVESTEGEQVGTIITNPRGVVYVNQKSSKREQFASLKLLSDRYNILIEKPKNIKILAMAEDVYGYPCESKAHNKLWDVRKQVPVFTKSTKSKSFYCAGYYIIKFNLGWVKSFCPKLITLNRYEYQGPYSTKEEMTDNLKKANGQS